MVCLLCVFDLVCMWVVFMMVLFIGLFCVCV